MIRTQCISTNGSGQTGIIRTLPLRESGYPMTRRTEGPDRMIENDLSARVAAMEPCGGMSHANAPPYSRSERLWSDLLLRCSARAKTCPGAASWQQTRFDMPLRPRSRGDQPRREPDGIRSRGQFGRAWSLQALQALQAHACCTSPRSDSASRRPTFVFTISPPRSAVAADHRFELSRTVWRRASATEQPDLDSELREQLEESTCVDAGRGLAGELRDQTRRDRLFALVGTNAMVLTGGHRSWLLAPSSWISGSRR